MPAPLPSDERDAIVDAIRAGKSRNAIAQEFGRSTSTITGIAQGAGLSFDRAQTKNATEATLADNAHRRAELARLLWEDALKLRGQLWRAARVYNFGGKDNTFNEAEIPEPGFRDKQAILTSVGIAVDKALALEAADRPNETKAAVLALVEMMRNERVAESASPEAAG